MIWDDASETYANLGWVGEGEGWRAIAVIAGIAKNWELKTGNLTAD
jgi:hypothetical protein